MSSPIEEMREQLHAYVDAMSGEKVVALWRLLCAAREGEMAEVQRMQQMHLARRLRAARSVEGSSEQGEDPTSRSFPRES